MKALQQQYTSCRKGLSGGSGFQTRSVSPGLTQEEQREIERWGGYRPPRDARQEPSDEEIALELPVAFRSYVLGSGRFAVTRSVYAGKDYSNRWGNFFAHTIVFEKDSPIPFWPIDLYEWEGWQGRLSEEEDSETAPEPLPAVDLTGIGPGESFQLPELSAFLREITGRERVLADMGRAMLLVRDKSRAVVVKDTPNSCLYWVGALQKLVPASYALRFSFSTYSDDPRGCADVNATTGETGFVFNDSERQYRFFMFDLGSGQSSDVPCEAGDYLSLAASWMAEEPALLEGFHAFVSLFRHDGPVADLLHAARLYQLSLGKLTVLDGPSLSGMIDFVTRFATAEGRPRLLGVLGAAAGADTSRLRAEDLQRLLQYLRQGAAETGLEADRRLTFKVWLSLVRDHVVHSGDAVREASSELEGLWTSFPVGRAALAELFFAEPYWTALPRLTLDAALFLLETSFQCHLALGRESAWDSAPVPALVERALETATVSGLARPLIERFPRDSEALSWLTTRLIRHQKASRSQDEKQRLGHLGQALRPALSRLDARGAQKWRSLLEAAGEFDVLLGEWQEWCERGPDPVRSYQEYEDTVLSQLPIYAKAARDSVVEKLFLALPERTRSAVAVGWIGSDSFKKLSPSTAGRIVALAGEAVSLRGGDAEADATAHVVKTAAKKLSLRLTPDRPLLREAIRYVRNPRSTLKDLDPGLLQPSASGLGKAEYQEFLREFLLAGLERSSSFWDHRILLAAAAAETRGDELRAVYLEFFEKPRDPVWTRALEAALHYWIQATSPESPGREAVLETARDGLVSVFLRLEPEELDGIAKRVDKAFPQEPLQLRWSTLLHRLKSRRRSPLRRIMNLFRRG